MNTYLNNNMNITKKITIGLLVLALLAVTLWQARCRTNMCDLVNKGQIEFADNKVSEIDANTNLAEIRKFLPDTSTEGGEALYYFENNVLSKIYVSYLGEMGSISYKYYFDNDELIYSDVNEVEYDAPIYVEESRVIDSKNSKYYFKNSNLIKVDIQDGNFINKCGEEFKDWENRLLTEVETLKNTIMN